MSQETQSDHVGYTGAQEITGLPLGTLYALVHQRRIPHVRLGRRLVRFSRRALAAWLEEHSVPPSPTKDNGPEAA
jgi:excisionase family DNA binding protein